MDVNDLQTNPCPVCANDVTVWYPPLGDSHKVNCPCCGKITLTGTAKTVLDHWKRSHPQFDIIAFSKKLKAQPRGSADPYLLISPYFLDAMFGSVAR